MANAKGKSKAIPSAQKTLHIAVAAVLWGFVESADASQSRSASAMSAVESAYSTLSAEQFAAVIAAEFGNGERGKQNVKGALIDELETKCKAADKTVPVSARGFVSQVRTVALNFGNADVRKAAAESGTRAAYDVAKPKAVNPKGETKAKPVTLLELIGAEIKAHGVAHVLGMIESACTALADPIRAGIVHDARVKIAA